MFRALRGLQTPVQDRKYRFAARICSYHHGECAAIGLLLRHLRDNFERNPQRSAPSGPRKPREMFLKLKSSGTYIEFVSSLPIEECMRRIRDNADENSIGILPVIGEFEATSFQLRKRSLLGNRFQTILTAQLVGMQNGKTILACHFGPKPLSGALILTIGFLLFAIVLFVGGAIFNPPRSGVVGVMEGISVPAAMLALIAASYALGRFIARNEGSFLTELLRETAQIEHDFGRHSGKN